LYEVLGFGRGAAKEYRRADEASPACGDELLEVVVPASHT
jgi:hypothetical protein